MCARVYDREGQKTSDMRKIRKSALAILLKLADLAEVDRNTFITELLFITNFKPVKSFISVVNLPEQSK